MRKVLCVVLIASALFACSDETTVYNETQDEIFLEDNGSILENSLVYDHSGVLEITDEDQITGKFAGTGKPEMAGDYPLTLVAQVKPPSYDGADKLTASHVHVEGDYAYVSYNTVEDDYVGGIDIINISDPNNPKVTSRLYYTNADINSIKYENGFVYAAGGVDAEKSVRATSNSFIAKIPAVNGKLNIDAGISYGFQEGYNATDVETNANSVLVTSGQEGFLTLYDKGNISIQNQSPFADLRSVAVNDNTIAVLDAGKGVSLLDFNLQVIKEIPINSDFGTNTKRTLDFSDGKIIVSEGAKGAGVYSAATGNLIEYIPILVNPTSVSPEDIVTNAVAINEKALLMANGGGGLCLSEDQGNSSNLIGIIELEGSINYVASKDDYIFAASGKEGLQIIKLNRPDASLASRCADLPLYIGAYALIVQQGLGQEFRGSKRFSSINVSGSLLLCGSWTTTESNYINANALFEMNGTLVVGRNNKRKNITVGKNATFRVEGDLTIYGDFILEDGAILEFIGNNSVVNIYGSVKKSGSAEVRGTFKDGQNKF